MTTTDPSAQASVSDAARRPFLTEAQAPLTHTLHARNEFGAMVEVSIPAERDLTIYVDKRELVTLMTLGAHPEWLVLGYLRNQRLLRSVDEIESITVDWEVGAAAVKTRHGISACESLEALAAYLAGPGSGIPYGSGEWVIVEMAGPVSGDSALDAEDGEFLILPERIVSVRPLDDEFFDMIGAAYDALTD